MKIGPTYVEDTEPALYVYRQRFHFPGDSEESVRDGVMGLLNRAGANVYPHEEIIVDRTAESPDDPGSLWLSCDDADSALGPVLQLTAPPTNEVTDRFGCRHQVWPVTDSAHIARIQEALEGKPLFVVDGHHRFAAGWNLATIQIRTSALRLRNHSALSVEQIEANARGGILLPPKTTDFFPKLIAGLVVHRLQKENVTPPVAQRPGVR